MLLAICACMGTTKKYYLYEKIVTFVFFAERQANFAETIS